MKNILFTLLTVFLLTLTTTPLFAASAQSNQGKNKPALLQNQHTVTSSTKEERKMRVRQTRQFLKAQADQEC